MIEVLDANEATVSDDELETLIRDVYVREGFTDPAAAVCLFRAGAVRQRGRIFVARDPVEQSLRGSVILVSPGSAACRVARAGEGEIQLLAVSARGRNAGIGRTLVEAALRGARDAGYSGVALRMQPTMHAAHRLYVRVGFARAPERDVSEGGRTFWAYLRRL